MQSTYFAAVITLMSCVLASWGSRIWRGRNFVLISRLHNSRTDKLKTMDDQQTYCGEHPCGRYDNSMIDMLMLTPRPI